MSADAATDFGLKIRPVTGRGGAEISGVKLSGDLQPATVKAIREALLAHKVIFFRGQTHLTDQEQEAFSLLLGEPVAHPTVPVVENTKYLLELDSVYGVRADSWHTDVTFVEAPPQASILRGVVIPEAGGDTIWANTEAAYENLPDALKEFANGLRAVHSNQYDYASQRPGLGDEAEQLYAAIFASTVYKTEHPVVRVHPETGKRSLLLGHFLTRFNGLSSHDSKLIYDLLQSHVTLEENTIRWRWQEGDVAIWDNRATQHKAINDYGDARRIVRRVTIKGDVPVGIDGRRGKSLTIRPSDAKQAA
jgi:taurine dioxygenase